MRTLQHPFIHAALASAIAVTLTACGGSAEVLGPNPNNSSTPDNSDATTPTAKLAVTGAVADGYLQGAKACLDLNRNKACDDGEPFAISGNGGRFTLEVPDGIDANAYSVVVDVGADAIDEDDNLPVGKPYVLSAPPGMPEFVSPITTMIHSTLEQNPTMSVEDAENELKTNLGVAGDVSLFKDYVKEKREGGNKEEYERIHRVAQVVASVLGDNITEVRNAAASAGLDPNAIIDKLVNLVINQVIEKLNVITQKVDEAKDETSFSANAISGTIKQDLKVDTDNVKKDVEALERVKNIAAASMRDILAHGVNWIEAWPNCSGSESTCAYQVEHGRIGLSADGTALEKSVRTFDLSSLSWTAFETGFNEEGTVLGANGWIDRSEAGKPKIEFHDDNSATLTMLGGVDKIRIKGAVLEIGAASIRDFAPAGKREWFLDQKFSSGATAYRWTFTQLSDLFELDHWNNDDDTCHDGKSPTEFGGNCNTVWGYGSSATRAPANTLAEVIFPPAKVPTGEAPAIHIGENLRVMLIGDPNDLSKGGVVRFKEAQSVITKPDGTKSYGAEVEIKNEASWKLKTVNGQRLIEFTIPAYLREKANHFDHTPHLILAEHKGWVRIGSYTPKGFVESERTWNYNDTAAKDLETALDTTAEFRFDNPHYFPGGSSENDGCKGESCNPSPHDPNCVEGDCYQPPSDPNCDGASCYQPPHDPNCDDGNCDQPPHDPNCEDSVCGTSPNEPGAGDPGDTGDK